MRPAAQTQRLVVALALLLAGGCVDEPRAGIPESDFRMLRAGVGPGLDRLDREIVLDRAVLATLENQGYPDYIYAPTPFELHLLYLAADRMCTLRGRLGTRVGPEIQEPIPDETLDLTAPDDAQEVRARRLDLTGRVAAPRPGWCGPGAIVEPEDACLAHPASAALMEEIRARVMETWRPPPSRHGGDRVIMRFSMAADGSLAQRCVRGTTSPSVAQSALESFDAVFPIPPLRGVVACLADRVLVVRLTIETN